MKRREYFMKRMAQDIDELPDRASSGEIEQLRKDHPGMTVLVPIGGRPVVTVMYTKTNAQGSKQEQEDSG